VADDKMDRPPLFTVPPPATSEGSVFPFSANAGSTGGSFAPPQDTSSEQDAGASPFSFNIEPPSFAGGSDNNVPSFGENDAGASPFGSGNDSSEGASPFGISSQEEAGASPFGNPVSSEGDSPFGSSAGDSPFENQEKQEDLPSPFSVPVERTETLTPMSMPIADGMTESLLENKSVIRLGKTDFAVGLFWQPLQDVDDAIPEIRETMDAEVGSDLYCIHYGKVPQYGIGKKSKGHEEGQVVGAVSLLDALSDRSSFVAVFHVDEGWWFVAARNDLILPEEDVLYQTEQEAKDAFFSMLAVPDWGYKIAPSSWNVDDTEEMELEALLRNTIQVKLVSLSAVRGTKVLLGIALGILVVVSLIVYFVIVLLNRAARGPSKVEPVVPRVPMRAMEPVQEPEKPWEKLVEIKPFVEKCWNNAYQLKSMTVPGWGLNEIVCTPEGIVTGWTKTWQQGGRLAWLQSAYDQYKFKNIQMSINETGTSASAVIKFDELPKSASNPMWSLARLRREFTDISQALNMRIGLVPQEITVSVPAPQGAQGTPEGQPTVKKYRYLAFSFTSSFDPPFWISFFDKFTAVELVKIKYNPRSNSSLSSNWSYEGRIYEK